MDASPPCLYSRNPLEGDRSPFKPNVSLKGDLRYRTALFLRFKFFDIPCERILPAWKLCKARFDKFFF